MRHTTDWTRSYLASATLGRERHTDSARVTTAEYPQEELLNPSVVLLRATSVSFSRNGGPDSYAAGLCEVVVIGHRHISKYMQCIHDHFDDAKYQNTYVFTFK